MSGWSEARETWDRDVRAARSRARAAIVGLGAMAAVGAFTGLVGALHIALLRRAEVPARAWELANSLREAGGLLELALGLVTGVLFLRWISRAVAAADALELVRGFAWTPSEAVMAFLLPVVNLVQPYKLLRDLHDSLAPDGAPEPAPRPVLDGAAGYRRVEVVHAPPAGAVHHAAIGVWWGLYLASGVLGWIASSLRDTTVAEFIRVRGVFIASDAAAIAAALLAMRVVRAVDSRIAERHRRLRYASDDELDGRLVERDRQLRQDLARLPGFDAPR
ncbi:DUF4328 domain-containing protein [Sorangium sp. So ce1335]|uniref:DUF4328 domain-containing protein n=1 Tax=Sorangium sp. So ce1335 TaxID=3133335 RepID=UPI003F62C303